MADGAPAAAPEGGGDAAPPRDLARIGAADYVRRGLEYAGRPRPEDQAEAERLLRKALHLDPKLAEARAGLARVSAYLYSLGLEETPARIAAALEEGRAAVEIDPGSAAARAAHAAALTAADLLTPALDEARRAVDLDPALADGHAILCGVLRLRRDLDGALAACRRAGALAPADARVLTALADVLREQERHGEAIEIYGQAIDLDHEAIAPQLGAAAALARQGNAPLARRAYNTLLTRWDYAQDRVRLAAAAFLAISRDWEQALEMYDRVAIPDNGTLPALLALYGKGYCLLQLDRPAEAEYFLSRLIERVPRDYDGPARGREFLFRAYGDLADYFESRGRGGRVGSLLEAAVGRPLAPTRLARRLAGLLQAGGRDAEAGALLERAVAGADPLEDPLELGESAILMARLRSGGGRRPLRGPAAAALRLVEGRIASSTIGPAHYRLARAYALAGQRQAAILSLERARRNGYLPPEQLRQEPDFEALRREPAFQALLD